MTLVGVSYLTLAPAPIKTVRELNNSLKECLDTEDPTPFVERARIQKQGSHVFVFLGNILTRNVNNYKIEDLKLLRDYSNRFFQEIWNVDKSQTSALKGFQDDLDSRIDPSKRSFKGIYEDCFKESVSKIKIIHFVFTSKSVEAIALSVLNKIDEKEKINKPQIILSWMRLEHEFMDRARKVVHRKKISESLFTKELNESLDPEIGYEEDDFSLYLQIRKLFFSIPPGAFLDGDEFNLQLAETAIALHKEVTSVRDASEDKEGSLLKRSIQGIEYEIAFNREMEFDSSLNTLLFFIYYFNLHANQDSFNKDISDTCTQIKWETDGSVNRELPSILKKVETKNYYPSDACPFLKHFSELLNNSDLLIGCHDFKAELLALWVDAYEQLAPKRQELYSYFYNQLQKGSLSSQLQDLSVKSGDSLLKYPSLPKWAPLDSLRPIEYLEELVYKKNLGSEYVIPTFTRSTTAPPKKAKHRSRPSRKPAAPLDVVEASAPSSEVDLKQTALKKPAPPLKSQLPFKYDQRVARWFRCDPDQPIYSKAFPEYKDQSQAQFGEKIIYHGFSPTVDLFLEGYGIKTLWKDRDPLYSLPAQIEGKKGVIGVCMDQKTKAIYHRFFTTKTSDELIGETANKSYKNAEFPLLSDPLQQDTRSAADPTKDVNKSGQIGNITTFTDLSVCTFYRDPIVKKRFITKIEDRRLSLLFRRAISISLFIESRENPVL